MFACLIQNKPNRAGKDLRRKLVRRLAHNGSSFSGVGASGNPGAVQTVIAAMPELVLSCLDGALRSKMIFGLASRQLPTRSLMDLVASSFASSHDPVLVHSFFVRAAGKAPVQGSRTWSVRAIQSPKRCGRASALETVGRPFQSRRWAHWQAALL